ncbi:polysaccharide deacetylase family protein [Salinarimonas rosea]|uniref:polysaccharide deacetylase family protein n=1 Tax=Salinarimonas rosea TaxID=552063 RepID=UPI00040E4AC1|nr:polysaccharide deacetylase family protein [Salinarimonas rosea]
MLKRAIISAGLYGSDLVRAHAWARFARGRGVILTFHHVRPPADEGFAPNRLLEIAPAFLETVLDTLDALGFDIVPLDAVPALLAGPEPERPFAVLTFDDGYRDNRDYAAPILAARGAPWTLFVTRDFALGRGRFWWRELEEAVRRSPRIRHDGLDLPARTDAEKARAFDTLYWRLRAGPEDALRSATHRLAEEAGVDVAALATGACLALDEIAALARDPLVTLGAHTLTHPMLAKHDVETARREIVESRAVLADATGREIRHLAYPVGDPGSAGPREFALAREAGFETAVTTRPGHLFAEHAGHLHALPRVSVNGLHQSAGALRALLSGLPLLAWNRGRRVVAP